MSCSFGRRRVVHRSLTLVIAGVLITALCVAAAARTEAAMTGGLVYAWGNSGNGELGDGVVVGERETPVLVSLPAGVTATAVASCGLSAYALGSDGTVYAWGLGFSGQLGDGGTRFTPVPVVVSMPAGVAATAIASSDNSAFALGSDGNVYAWGDAYLGDGTSEDSNIPVVVSLPGDVTATAIAAGVTTAYAIGSDGNVYAWGVGALGNGSNGPSLVPVRVSLPPGVTATAIAAGQAGAYAIGSDGNLYAWGSALGNGTNASSEVPVPVSLPAGVTATAVSVAAMSAYALGSDGNIYAWGNGSGGQLGNGTFNNSDLPVQVSMPPGVTAKIIGGGGISQGTEFAEGSDGLLYAWGYNGDAELGNGTTTDSDVPILVQLPAGVTATSMAAGGETSYAVAYSATTPGAPGAVTASAQEGSAQVSFSPAQSNGAAVTSYTVTATDLTTPDNGGQTASGPGSPITVSGLADGDSYTFTVTATNAVGTGPASASSSAVTILQRRPAAPTSLMAPSPTNINPSLSWNTVSDATSYNIYRDGVKIGNSTASSYTDTTATEGSRVYYVTAVNSGGESPPSNTASVLVDRTAPSIAYTFSPAPNNNGWNNSQVTVAFTCADNAGDSGILFCPGAQTRASEGAGQQVTGTAIDNAGNKASVTATVNIDETPPAITAAASPAPNGSGWNNTPVTVTYTCTDALSGVASCPNPVTESADGTYTVSGTAADRAGNTSTAATTAVDLDTTTPVVSSAFFSTDPKSVSQPADTLTTQLSDPVVNSASSGIETAQYYDPVQQAWLPMMLNGTTATATITTSATAYPSGMYAFKVRTTDNADNVSQPVTVYLDIYNPSRGYAAGHGTITPSGSTSNHGDTLPAETGNNVRADFNFTVKYATATDTTPSGSSIFTWGSNCNSPHSNCFSMTTDFSGAVVPSWFIVDTTTGTATFQGSATLSQGATNLGSGYPVRITTTSGPISGTTSNYLLQIYPAGSNPDTATPLYQASGDLMGGQVVMHG